MQKDNVSEACESDIIQLIKKYPTWGLLITISFLCFLFTSCGVSGSSPQSTSKSASLSWEPPTTNADGTELTDLAGFKIYYGKASGTYTEVKDVNTPLATEDTIEGLTEGTYYFAATAYDTTGNESNYSNEVSKIIK